MKKNVFLFLVCIGLCSLGAVTVHAQTIYIQPPDSSIFDEPYNSQANMTMCLATSGDPNDVRPNGDCTYSIDGTINGTSYALTGEENWDTWCDPEGFSPHIYIYHANESVSLSAGEHRIVMSCPFEQPIEEELPVYWTLTTDSNFTVSESPEPSPITGYGILGGVGTCSETQWMPFLIFGILAMVFFAIAVQIFNGAKGVAKIMPILLLVFGVTMILIWLVGC